MTTPTDWASLVMGGAMLAPGYAQSYTIADPGAGVANATRTIKGEAWERVMMARATFTADANAGIRIPRLEYVDVYGNVLYAIPLAGGVGPSGTITANFAANAADEVTAAGPDVTPTIAAPAAGTDFTYTVPAGRRFLLESLDATLTTSATVGNRTAQIVIDDGVNVLWRWVSPATQAASLAYEYVGGIGGTEYSAVRSNVLAFALPQITVASGYRIRSAVSGIVAGDQWSAPHLSQDLFVAGQVNQRMPDVVLQSGYGIRFAHDSIGAGDAWTGIRLYVIRYPTDTTGMPIGTVG